ncbi:MAG: hypothetical protein R2880_07960 [Deinococcales bacterium]
MNHYVALVGLYIALAVPPEKAPLPNPTKPFDHAHDFIFGPLVAYIGTEIPQDVLPHLQNFQGERQLSRTIEEGRIASAYLSPKLMLGGETPHPFRLPNEQFHAATAHWCLPQGGLGYLRLRADKRVSVHVEHNRMILKPEVSQTLSFEFCFGLLNETSLHNQSWQVAGLEIAHDIQDDLKLEGDKIHVLSQGQPITLSFKLS